MPVAILRRKLSDLPLDFTLDDTNAMTPEATLSRTGRVVLGARISSRGDVVPAPGDAQGFSAPVAVGTRGVSVQISEVIK